MKEPSNKSIIEALLFSTNRLLGIEDIQEIFKTRLIDINEKEIFETIDLLNKEYSDTGRSFSIVNFADKFRICTNPEFSEWVRELLQIRSVETLSKPALETLAIIAYRQPITKMDVEAIRGVSIDGVLKKLIDVSLVEVAGRKEVIGKPFLYKTAARFLDYFGLKNLDELPRRTELVKTINEKATNPHYS